MTAAEIAAWATKLSQPRPPRRYHLAWQMRQEGRTYREITKALGLQGKTSVSTYIAMHGPDCPDCQ